MNEAGSCRRKHFFSKRRIYENGMGYIGCETRPIATSPSHFSSVSHIWSRFSPVATYDIYSVFCILVYFV